MKTISKRAYSLFIYIGIFAVCFGLYMYDYSANAATWVSDTANKHLYTGNAVGIAGSLYDRDGKVLLQNKDGRRIYGGDAASRTAMLHVVGDKENFISTSVSYIYRRQNVGYNLIDGTYQAGHGSKGNDMWLTVSMELSRRAYELLDGKKGAVCMFNYRTGEMLVMVSSPSFDPENKPDIPEGSQRYDGVYINRAISATYPPGSTFKLVTATAAINNIPDVFGPEYEFTCTGSYTTPDGSTVTCPREHGRMNFRESLAESCNGAFARIAIELTGPTLEREAKKIGFGTRYYVGEIPVKPSSVDMSDAGPNALGYSAIGQYTDLATPFQMMLLSGAIANDGVPMRPYIVDTVGSNIDMSFLFPKGASLPRTVPAETAEKMREMMKFNVTYKYGSDTFYGLEVGGKTGTAEVGGDKAAHSWFTAFLDDPDHPYAIAVISENSGAGASVAMPIAARLLREAAGR